MFSDREVPRGTMLERERHRLILKLVNERAVIGVPDLVDLLDASEATIRRDINALAESGELKRVRGGAEALHPRHEPHLAGVPFFVNQSVALPEKRAIARAAAGLIGPTDSLIITGGTTTWRLVEFLKNRDCDILTNSFPIAAELLAHSRSRITLPGGTIYREQSLILSLADCDVVDQFAASILFTGAYALGQQGFMETDPLVAQATRRLLKRAERLVVIVDSRKLRQRSSMVVAALSRINVVVTDDGAGPAEVAALRDAGTEVVIAPVLAEDRAFEAAA
jgi:DeoR family ulaG and ulaABCDEF operon transcriptional repressor